MKKTMREKRTRGKNPAAVIIIIFLTMSLCSTANAAIGIGISPANLTITDALKGGTYERTITVFNTGDDAGTFLLTTEGDCAGWISFYRTDARDTPVTEVTIPGKGKAKINVRFDIPEDVANGDYSAIIYAQSVPKTESEGGAVAHAVVRIPSKVHIRVTGTQILKGSVKSITTTDTEINYPLKIKVVFRNDGNVIAKPTIAVAIMKDSRRIDSFVHAETGIKPAHEGIITALWNTTGMETGDYIANVGVSLGDSVLATEDLHFKILPFGSLTRRGSLKRLTIEGEPLVNRVIKVVACFENTGQIDTMAKFKGELYREGELLDVLESEEMFVETNETVNLTDYYKITSSGNYTIKGRVLYAGKETAEKSVAFEVSTPCEKSEKSSNPTVPGFECTFSMISLLLIHAMRKWKKKDRGDAE